MRAAGVSTLIVRLAAFARRSLREAIPPRLLIHWVSLRNWISGEPELRLVPQLCDPRRSSIDVGASMGTYAYFMRRRSRSVILLEPHPVAANWLTRAFGSRAEVLQVAASDKEGRVALRIPRDPARRGMATVEFENRLEGVDTDAVEVVARPLDGLSVGPIGLIKIDVEGHEAVVLQGAAGIIARDRPVFVIEAEERHRPGAVRDVEATLSSHGYAGWYLRHGRLHPMSEFDVGRDQPGTGVCGGRKVRGVPYINNFIFVHRDDDRRDEFLRRNGARVFRPG